MAYLDYGIKRIVVVGAANIDIGGQPYNPLIMADSNPGSVKLSLGGVGRNIAHNLALLGNHVDLLTALGADLYAEQVRDSCRELGIGLEHALCTKDASTSVYLFIKDDTGDMALAISDMESAKKITPDYLAANMRLINRADAVVADTNIPIEALEYLAEHCQVPIFADPVSVTKAEKLKGILGKIYGLKANHLEAEMLTGVRIQKSETLEGSAYLIKDEDAIREAARILLEAGVKNVLISLGTKGMLIADAKEMYRIPAVTAYTVNASGAGDACTAALTHALIRGYTLKESAEFAAAAAAMAVESEDTVNGLLCSEAVERRRLEACEP